MKYNAISKLKAGDIVSISTNNRIVKIKTQTGTYHYDISKSWNKIDIDDNLWKTLRFKKIAKIDEEIGSPLLCTVNFQRNSRGNEIIKYVKGGVVYTLPIGDIKEAKNDGELILELFLVTYIRDYDAEGLALVYSQFRCELKEDESVIAVLDILGFKELINKRSLDEVEKGVIGQLFAILEVVDWHAAVVVDVGNIKGSGYEKISTLKHGIVSDTIFLYSEDRSNESLEQICEAVSFLIGFGIHIGVLLRGAITLGEFRAIENRNIYIGKALVTAYELEHGQEWVGCVLDNCVRQRMEKQVLQMTKKGLLVEYPVPKKSVNKDDAINRHAINWWYFIISDMKYDDKEKKLEQNKQDAPEIAKTKLQNTIDFLTYIKQNNLCRLSPLSMRTVE